MLIEDKIKNELEKIGYKEGIDFKLLSENKLYDMDDIHIFAQLEAETWNLSSIKELVDELAKYKYQNKKLTTKGIENLVTLFIVDVAKENKRNYPKEVYTSIYFNINSIYQKAIKHSELRQPKNAL